MPYTHMAESDRESTNCLEKNADLTVHDEEKNCEDTACPASERSVLLALSNLRREIE